MQGCGSHTQDNWRRTKNAQKGNEVAFTNAPSQRHRVLQCGDCGTRIEYAVLPCSVHAVRDGCRRRSLWQNRCVRNYLWKPVSLKCLSDIAPEMGIGEEIGQFYFTQMISGVVSRGISTDRGWDCTPLTLHIGLYTFPRCLPSRPETWKYPPRRSRYPKNLWLRSMLNLQRCQEREDSTTDWTLWKLTVCCTRGMVPVAVARQYIQLNNLSLRVRNHMMQNL